MLVNSETSTERWSRLRNPDEDVLPTASVWLLPVIVVLLLASFSYVAGAVDPAAVWACLDGDK